MSKFFDVNGKRIIGAGAALASVALAFVIGSTPAKADWHHEHWEHRGYWHHPHYYAPPVVYGPPVAYGPPVVYERPVYAPPPAVYYGAPGINVTIPLR
ncbi:MAG TPA: hypothetical protein VL574_05670 [Stellaceae bacterium]|jgi:hypothetical protein|nr:hypothetical protein [Stellaceae bacterium]